MVFVRGGSFRCLGRHLFHRDIFRLSREEVDSVASLWDLLLTQFPDDAIHHAFECRLCASVTLGKRVFRIWKLP